MSAAEKVFYDGMENIRLGDGVIHLTFYNLKGSGNDEKREPAGEIVLSQQAFLRAFGAMENLVSQMEKAGIVKRRGPEAAAAAAAPGSSPAPNQGEGGPAAGGSPNFQ